MGKVLNKIISLVDFGQLRLFKEKKEFFIAFLLFVSSLGIITSHVILLSMFLIIKTSPFKLYKITIELKIVLVIALLSAINECIHQVIGFNWLGGGDCILLEPGILEIIPYALLIFITIWAAKVCDIRILKWIIILSVFEIFVGIGELCLGVNSLFPDSTVEMGEFREGALLYNFKVNGLGVNSTSIGYKSFLSLLIYERFPECRFMKRWLFILLCIVGTILSFNRTIMIGIAMYFGMFLLKKENRKYFVLLAIAILGLFLYIPTLYDDVILQITRGGTDAANLLSGREDIFPLYMSFIKQNFFLGNGSFKLFFMSSGVMLHAHNAYLQTVATNGIIISFFYVILISVLVNRYNYRYAIPILVCGLSQTFILWGTSLPDFIFYVLMVNICLPKNEIRNTIGIKSKTNLEYEYIINY